MYICNNPKCQKMKSFLSTLLLLFIGLNIFAIAKVPSGMGTASWTNAASWSPAGVPNSGDDVTITSGSTISLNAAAACRHLTIDPGGVYSGLSNSAVLSIYGNYSNNGTESGIGTLAFFGLGTSTIGGTGAWSSNFAWSFNKSRTILSTVSYSRTANTKIYNGSTVTNNGTLTLNITTVLGGAWTQGPNSSLTLRQGNFFAGTTLMVGTFNASAVGNTVSLAYATGDIPRSLPGYYNLRLTATTAGTKSMRTAFTVTNDLTINATNTFNTNAFDLVVGGDWVKNGTFTTSAGRLVTFNGASGSAQTISGTGTTAFQQVTINNPLGVSILSGTYTLAQVLTISDGTFSQGGTSFTMLSTAAQTARIAPVTGTGAITGNFTIQRFLSARTQSPTDDPGHWSNLSSSVQSSTVADWDNELFLYYPYAPPTQYSNIVIFNETANDYVGVSAATSLTPGLGFEIALTDDGTLTAFSATTLTTTGVPNHLDQDLSALISFNGDGSNLVGNPFASSIAWSSVFAASSGILNTYDEYDSNAGDYATFGLGSEIGSGQGFWVYTTSPVHTLNVPETAKTTSTNSTILAPMARKHMILNIRGAHEPDSYRHKLHIAASSDASDGWDLSDHPYKKSPVRSAPSITSKVDNKELKINTFNSLNETYTMPLSTRGQVSGNYTIEIESRDILEEYSCIYLEDTQTNKWLDLNVETSYSFNMNAGDNEERFVLHFSKNGDCKAPQYTVVNELNNQLIVLPTAEGNDILFNMNDATNVRIDVTNMLGQQLMNSMNITASNQTEKIALPSDFTGMYLIRISSDKETMVKKFVRK